MLSVRSAPARDHLPAEELCVHDVVAGSLPRCAAALRAEGANVELNGSESAAEPRKCAEPLSMRNLRNLMWVSCLDHQHWIRRQRLKARQQEKLSTGLCATAIDFWYLIRVQRVKKALV